MSAIENSEIYGKLLAACCPEPVPFDGDPSRLFAIVSAANKLSELAQFLLNAHRKSVEKRYKDIQTEHGRGHEGQTP